MCPLSYHLILSDPAAALFLARFVDPPLLITATILALLPFIYTRRWRTVALFLLALALTYLTTFLLKELFQIERPGDALFEEDTFRFPSGHTSAAAAFTMTLYLAYYRWIPTRNGRRILAAIAITVPFAVGIVRIVLGVHCVPDVLLGVAVGVASSLAAAWCIFREFPWSEQKNGL